MALDALMIELDICAPVETLWRAWTEPSEVSSWLAEKANVCARPGGPFELFWDPDNTQRNSTLGCIVLAVDEPHRLSFSWKGPEPFAALMNQEPLPTRVTLSLQELGQGRTRLRLEHSGWGEGAGWAQAKAWHENVWRTALGGLKTRLEPTSRI